MGRVPDAAMGSASWLQRRVFCVPTSCSGAAHDDKEAREVALALHRAGVLLLHHDTVYLRPEDIAAIVMQVRESLPPGMRIGVRMHVCTMQHQSCVHSRAGCNASSACSMTQ